MLDRYLQAIMDFSRYASILETERDELRMASRDLLKRVRQTPLSHEKSTQPEAGLDLKRIKIGVQSKPAKGWDM